MEGLSLTEVQNGVKRWILEADRADYLKDRNEIRISGIYLEFYGEQDRVVSLSCREGVVDTKTRGLTLKDGVEVTEGDLKITTDLVRYLPQERVLVAPSEVVLEAPRLRVEGRDLTIHLAGRRLVLSRHRLTEVTLNDGMRL
jgi:LPS export ABC transporter protein LptC